jgi:hypothetical protein
MVEEKAWIANRAVHIGHTPPTPKWPPAWGPRDISVSVIISLGIVILPCNYTFPHRSIVGICVAAVNIGTASFGTLIIVDIA